MVFLASYMLVFNGWDSTGSGGTLFSKLNVMFSNFKQLMDPIH